MNSNTKLFPEQEQYVKNFEWDNTNACFLQNGEITVLVMPEFKDSRMYKVSVSTMSPDEIKFRTYVGRYFALSNMENGQYVLMNSDTVFGFLDNTLCLTTDNACENLEDLGIVY